MNIRQFAFLIFHDSNDAFALVEDVSFFHVFNQLFCLHLKNSSHNVRTIRCDLFRFQFISYFESIRIDRKNDEERKSFEMFDYNHVVLKQFLHESRIARIIERKNKSSIENRRINVVMS
jgi:hypothetical protein